MITPSKGTRPAAGILRPGPEKPANIDSFIDRQRTEESKPAPDSVNGQEKTRGRLKPETVPAQVETY